jgi:hypothetical protein
VLTAALHMESRPSKLRAVLLAPKPKRERL